MINKYPYTNFHELNADWIISKVSDIDKAVKESKEQATEAKASAEYAEVRANQANTSAEQAEASANQANTSAEQAEASASLYNGVNDKLEALNARVNQFEQLEDGSTTGDAELMDARITYNGITKDNVGDAIRYQITNLHALADSASVDYLEMNGYLTSEGNIHQPSADKIEKTTTWLPVEYGDIIRFNFISNDVLSFWSAYMYFNETGSTVSQRYVLDNVVEGNNFEHYVIIDDINAKYIAFSYRTFGYDYDLIIKRYQKDLLLNTGYNNAINLEPVTLELEDGYIHTDGSVIVDTSTGNNEKHTQLIPLNIASKLLFNLVTDKRDIQYITCAYYDKNENFINRSSNLLPVRDYATSNSLVIVTDNNMVKYIKLSFRTYNHFIAEAFYGVNAKGIISTDINNVDNKRVYNFGTNGLKNINHRGYSTDYPENTLIAFKQSKLHGFNIVECDVKFTSDRVAVLLHDATINRTARNDDGTELDTPININNITYQELLNYDFGLWKGEQFRGTKIPTLKDFLKLCRDINLCAYIELHTSSTPTQEEVNDIIKLIKKYGLINKVSIISFYPNILNMVLNADAQARIGLVADTNTSNINNAIAMITNANQVFILAHRNIINDDYVTQCVNNDIELEAWLVDANTVLNLNNYVTGFESNKDLCSIIVYDNAMQ